MKHRATLGLPSACSNMITSTAPSYWFQKPLSPTAHTHHAQVRSGHENEEICQNSMRTARKQQGRASTSGTQCKQCPKQLLEYSDQKQHLSCLDTMEAQSEKPVSVVHSFNRHGPEMMIHIYSFMAYMLKHRKVEALVPISQCSTIK